LALSPSSMFAAWTTATSNNPSVSTETCRLAPLLVFPGASPRVPLLRVTLPVWLSTLPAPGSGRFPEDSRTGWRTVSRIYCHSHV
jgi:hypothetical protein